MIYKRLHDCIRDLEMNDQLIRIKNEVDPNLEMSKIHLEEFSRSGKAILYERVRGSKYSAVSNLFGTLSRCHFIFRRNLKIIKKIIKIKKDPYLILSNPIKSFILLFNMVYTIPKKVVFPSNFKEISIQDLPQIFCS